MSDRRGTESEFELTTIARLEQLGYKYAPGIELDRPPDEVVLRRRLRNFLASQYRDLPDAAIELAVIHFMRPKASIRCGATWPSTNGWCGATKLPLELSPGHAPTVWSMPSIGNTGKERIPGGQPVSHPWAQRPASRPGLFVNGLPLAVFELKNPYSEEPTVQGAWNQIQHYRNDIPQLFDYNAITVISDGVSTLHGMWTADEEWYAPWKSIDGVKVEPATTASMKSLLKACFAPSGCSPTSAISSSFRW